MGQSIKTIQSQRRPFVVALFGFLFIIQVATVCFGVVPGMRGRSDFRHLYIAGYLVRTGNAAEIYDYEAGIIAQKDLIFGANVALPPFNHLAFEALLFAPLSYLRFPAAYMTFLLLNLAILGASMRLIFPYLNKPREEWNLLPIAAFACFLPVAITLIQGQDSLILLFLLVAAFRCVEGGRDDVAGLILSATLFKFQFAIVIALLFFFWRRWKFVCGFALGAVIVVAVSFTVSSPSQYLHYLLSMSSGLGPRERSMYAIDPALMMNIRGFLYGALHSVIANGPLQWATLSVSLVVMLRAIGMKPSLGTAILVSALCSYHCLIHDMIILLIPLTVFSFKSKMMTAWCAVAFVAPSAFLIVNANYWPICVPLLLLFLLL
jgi:hypothetical protein